MQPAPADCTLAWHGHTAAEHSRTSCTGHRAQAVPTGRLSGVFWPTAQDRLATGWQPHEWPNPDARFCYGIWQGRGGRQSAGVWHSAGFCAGTEPDRQETSGSLAQAGPANDGAGGNGPGWRHRRSGQRALEEEALLDSLLGVDDRDAFLLACRFLTSMEQPTEAALDRIAQGWTDPSPVVDSIMRLCDSDTPADRPIRAALEMLGAWLEQHQQPQPWRELLTQVVYELTMQVLLTRMDPAAPEAAGRKAVQARALIPWLLQQPGLCRSRQEHKGTDYMLRWAMDGLVQLGGWEAEAPLDAWYRDWLALESVYQRCAEPQLSEADAEAFRDWRPSCYGGRLSRLEALLAGAGSGQKPQDLSQGLVDAGSEDVKRTPSDGGQDRQNWPKKNRTGDKRTVLAWHSGGGAVEPAGDGSHSVRGSGP